MRISELARRTGVSTHRLRRYDELGLIRAGRTDRGYREYDEHVVREVTFVAMGRELGFSLAELGELVPRYRDGTVTIDEMVSRLGERIAAVDAQMAELAQARARLVEHVAWFEERRAAARARAEEETA
ncbi:MerR family transcriptional regulator [Mumia sp. DW29H23]|uniref:MerR family transcriptional regulator n=1 Tax=Mumia sp. DW29H23 TaxID=3421241 RepID=UPI003D690819